MRGREKLEQSKASWRLGLGSLLNGPICPLCCQAALMLRVAKMTAEGLAAPLLFRPLTNRWSKSTPFTLNSVTSGVPGTNHQTSLRIVGWSHTRQRWCFPCMLPWEPGCGGSVQFLVSRASASPPLPPPPYSLWHGKDQWFQESRVFLGSSKRPLEPSLPITCSHCPHRIKWCVSVLCGS